MHFWLILGLLMLAWPALARIESLPHGPHDVQLGIASQHHGGVKNVNKFGNNPEITKSPLTYPEDVWSTGGLWVPPQEAQTLNVSSDSVQDDPDPAGTGVYTIQIEGLDENWNFQTEVVTLNGTTAVPTNNQWWRVYRAFSVTSANGSGAGGVNQGIISIVESVAPATNVVAEIPAFKGQTLMAIYTVPAGKTAYITNVYGATNRTGGTAVSAQLSLVVSGSMDASDAVSRTKFVFSVESAGSSVANFPRFPYIRVPEKHDIKMRVLEVSGTCDISAGFDMIVVDNP